MMKEETSITKRSSSGCKLGFCIVLMVIALLGAGVTVYLLVIQKYRSSASSSVSSIAGEIPQPAPIEDLNILATAKASIENLIDQDRDLAAKFLRLGFHDCIGGCDGCVDLQNPDNRGLEIPIQALHNIVQTYETDNITRGDIWALAAMTGAEISQRNNDRIDFTMNTIGRINCENRGPAAPCLDQDGNTVECSEMRGPHRGLPSNDVTTHGLLTFFEDTFGFDERQTVAIMGAHTIGEANRRNSGFNGGQGWVRRDQTLDNEYYDELVGGNANSDLEELIDAPNWRQIEIENADISGIPNRFQWIRTGNRRGNGNIFMLNADISLVRDFTNLIDDRGEVSCEFERPVERRCPHAAETIRIAADFRSNNDLWLAEFRNVMTLMVNQGL